MTYTVIAKKNGKTVFTANFSEYWAALTTAIRAKNLDCEVEVKRTTE